MIETIFGYLIVVFGVLFYLWFGCFVGREYGSFENFIKKCIKAYKEKQETK